MGYFEGLYFNMEGKRYKILRRSPLRFAGYGVALITIQCVETKEITTSMNSDLDKRIERYKNKLL